MSPYSGTSQPAPVYARSRDRKREVSGEFSRFGSEEAQVRLRHGTGKVRSPSHELADLLLGLGMKYTSRAP